MCDIGVFDLDLLDIESPDERKIILAAAKGKSETNTHIAVH